MTRCIASSSGPFEPFWKISTAANFSPCMQHSKAEWTPTYARAKGQIWTSNRSMRRKTEARLCAVLTLLIKTVSIPAETLLTWAQPWNKNADSLPSRHSYSLLFQPPTPFWCCFLTSLLSANTTSHAAFHGRKSVRNKGNKNQESTRGHAAKSRASVCT